MRKVALLIGIACCVVMFGGVASTLEHVFLGVVDPNISVEAFKHRDSSTSGYWEDALVRFSLQGTGTANGSVTVSTDDYTQPWARLENSTTNPNLYGGFTFSGDNFASLFLAQTYCWWGWHGGTYLNQHNLEVTAPSNFNVSGDAFAVTADSAPQNAGGQQFDGSAQAVNLYASRMVIDHRTNTWTGAQLDATVTASSATDVTGYTEGRYFHTTHHFPLAVPEMGNGGIMPPFAEGFGFMIDPSSGNTNATFQSTYPYQGTFVFSNMIGGEAGTWKPSWGEPWQAWPDYPGDYPIYGDPIP